MSSQRLSLPSCANLGQGPVMDRGSSAFLAAADFLPVRLLWVWPRGWRRVALLLLQERLSFIWLLLNANRGAAAVSTLNEYSGYLCSRVFSPRHPHMSHTTVQVAGRDLFDNGSGKNPAPLCSISSPCCLSGIGSPYEVKPCKVPASRIPYKLVRQILSPKRQGDSEGRCSCGHRV